MAKKLGSTSLFSTTSSSFSSVSSTPWPSCKQQKAAHSFMTMNPTYFDLTDSCRFTNSSTADSESFSTVSELSGSDAVVEAVIRGLRSADRLFFEPGCTNSIMEIKSHRVDPVDQFEGGVAMAVDSKDFYGDFRRSMEEMIMAHGVKGWDWLEEMLGWYLKANGEKTHGFIVGAFVDLLVSLATSSSSSSSSSSTTTTTTTTTTTPCSPFSSFCFGIHEEKGNGSFSLLFK